MSPGYAKAGERHPPAIMTLAMGKSLLTVRRWRRRNIAKGVDGLLKDASRPSRVKPLTPEKIEQVVHMTLHEKPSNAAHWSVRSMAAAAGISTLATSATPNDTNFQAQVPRLDTGFLMGCNTTNVRLGVRLGHWSIYGVGPFHRRQPTFQSVADLGGRCQTRA